MKSLTIEEIETLFYLIVKKLKADTVNLVEFEMDLYWIILSDEWSVSNDPPAPAVGSLDEDVSFLKEAIEEGEIYSYSNLDRMASVLRAISEMQAPTK